MQAVLHSGSALCSIPAVAESSHTGSGMHTADSSSAVNSHNLLRGNKAVTIQHNGTLYRLQATRLGKLILTK